jgi:membrane-associated protein
MEHAISFTDLFFNLDGYIRFFIQNYGSWVYLLLFLIIFCETGLVVTPILPGDSLLFAVGTFCGVGLMDLTSSILLFSAAAVLGNINNYCIGKIIGQKVFHYEKSRIFKKEYLDKTKAYFEKYGGKTIIITRFVPIVRTFAPFVAGVGAMRWWRFSAYNLAGGILWVSSLTFLGYFFGNIPLIKDNYTIVIFAIIIISILPAVIEYIRGRKASHGNTEAI